MYNSEEDVLDMLDKKDDTFKVETKTYNNNNNNSYNNYNNKFKQNKFNNNKFKSNKPSLWDKTDFKPKRIDANSPIFNNKTTVCNDYMWYGFLPKSYTIPAFIKNIDNLKYDDVLCNILDHNKFFKVIESLNNKDYVYRHNSNSEDRVANAILEINDIKYKSYLPWKKYNLNIENPILLDTEEPYCIAAGYHSKFKDLPSSIRAILANIVQTLLGKNCDEPVKFVLCYTDCGSEKMSKGMDFNLLGNLGFILKICEDANIPVLNFKNEHALRHIKELVL